MKKIFTVEFLLASFIANAQKPEVRIDKIISFDSLNGIIKMTSPNGQTIRFPSRRGVRKPKR